LLREIFERCPDVFQQYNTKELIYSDKAIVIVVGQRDIPPLKEYLDTFQSAIVIFTGDEECAFDADKLRSDKLEMWTQCYSPHRAYMKERIFLGTPNRLYQYKINDFLKKKYLWSFVGQNHNPHRNQCISVMKKLKDGHLHVTDRFGGYGKKGMPFQAYLDITCMSKYVICPSGSFTADTFRVYEAIECGSIPICDKRSPRDAPDFNYWNQCYPQNNLITVDSWLELPDILQSQPESDGTWWVEYKEYIANKLIKFAE